MIEFGSCLYESSHVIHYIGTQNQRRLNRITVSVTLFPTRYGDCITAREDLVGWTLGPLSNLRMAT